MSPTGERRDEGGNIRTRQNPLGPQERQTRASVEQKYNESRLVDHARFNDETGNENHNDEIINGESIPIYSFIVLKIFIYDGLSRNYDIEARKDKILKDFAKTELITVCTILGLNCAGSAKELSEHIFKNLSDLASLKNNFTEQLTDDEDEDSAPFSLESTNDANKQPLTPPIYHLPSPQDVFVPLPQTQRNQSQRGNEENVFLLKDLFSTMRSFTGNDNYSVKAFSRRKSELVAIKRTQFGTGLKLRPKFYGPYRIKTVKPHDRYEVEKVGQHEGPHLTSTAVDFMKRWSTADA
ncbi:putative blastopia polyprotein [Trichonephila clavipes]|nr:putative blastopia polyprotein [Trichonephila clavipes]